MPELPEAETIARELAAQIDGGVFRRVRIHRAEVVEPGRPDEFARSLTGRRVERVGRRAKWIVVGLDDGRRWVTQLRMTGRFAWMPSGPLRAALHLSISLLIDTPEGEGVLRFYDVRRFGRMRLLDAEGWQELDARLGIEPLCERFTPSKLAEALAGSRAPLRNALLDQERIAGLGNIYASESCHHAGLDPRRPGGGLGREEVKRLHAAIRTVLLNAIQRRGTSFSDYRALTGETGDFQNELAVYGRAGEPCPRCEGVVERAVLAGRSAFFCPDCQG